jgi:hypothetical protein
MGNWSGAGQGAAGGAMAGAAFGPWGAAIGGIGGGLLGYFSDDPAAEARARQEKLYAELQRSGPSERGAYSEFRRNQQDYIRTLEAAAAGRGPSLATETMKAATDRSARQAQGLTQTGAGNQAAAMMMAQEASGQMGAQNAQAAAVARIEEQERARQLLGINLHGARGADEDMNRFNASQGNNFRLAKAGLQGTMSSDMANRNYGPTQGEQILAGGASAYGQYQAQRTAMGAQKRQEQENQMDYLERQQRENYLRKQGGF